MTPTLTLFVKLKLFIVSATEQNKYNLANSRSPSKTLVPDI